MRFIDEIIYSMWSPVGLIFLLMTTESIKISNKIFTETDTGEISSGERWTDDEDDDNKNKNDGLAFEWQQDDAQFERDAAPIKDWKRWNSIDNPVTNEMDISYETKPFRNENEIVGKNDEKDFDKYHHHDNNLNNNYDDNNRGAVGKTLINKEVGRKEEPWKYRTPSNIEKSKPAKGKVSLINATSHLYKACPSVGRSIRPSSSERPPPLAPS